MQKPERGPGSVDWHRLKAEYLSTQISLNKLREKNGLAFASFFKKVKGWNKEKAALQKKAIKRVEAEVIDFYADYIRRSRKFLTTMMDNFEQLVQDGRVRDQDGKLWPLGPDSLLDLAKAFAENMKTVRLIENKSTENKAIGVQADGDLHGALMQLIHVIEGKEDKPDA